MRVRGWTTQPSDGVLPGHYCRECASALQMIDTLVRCSECGRAVESEAAAERLGWRYYADGMGELVPLCGKCGSARSGSRSASA
jgi:hypothetical protein